MIFFNPLIQAHGKKNIVCPFLAVILSKIHTERAPRQGDCTLESAAVTVPHLARVKRVSVESWLHFCWVAFGDLASAVCHGRLPDWVFWPLGWPFFSETVPKKCQWKADSSFVELASELSFSLSVHLVISSFSCLSRQGAEGSVVTYQWQTDTSSLSCCIFLYVGASAGHTHCVFCCTGHSIYGLLSRSCLPGFRMRRL